MQNVILIIFSPIRCDPLVRARESKIYSIHLYNCTTHIDHFKGLKKTIDNRKMILDSANSPFSFLNSIDLQCSLVTRH